MFRHADVVCLCLVSCVHPVAVLNAAFCMTCSLLMLVEDAIGDHTEEAYSRAPIPFFSDILSDVPRIVRLS